MNDTKEIVRPNWEEFYDYRYWREEQRRQLTIVSNVYFALSSAMIGFTIKYLIDYINGSLLGCEEKVLLLTGVCFNILSLVLYVLLTDNKLKDYRETAQKIAVEKYNADDIGSSTSAWGKKTWELFKLQKIFLIIGFAFLILLR